MNLFIDTTTKYVSLITFTKDQIIDTYQYEGNNDHTLTIYKYLQKIELEQIEAVYVTAGPGSYTGVRIGLLVAKTLSHELNVDLYTINTLELFYLGYKQAVLLDARGRKFFRFDGFNFSQIKYEQQSDEIIIESYVKGEWLISDIKSKFRKTDAINVKADYMKAAI